MCQFNKLCINLSNRRKYLSLYKDQCHCFDKYSIFCFFILYIIIKSINSFFNDT